MGTKGYVKEGLELTPMGSFDVGQGGVSTPDLIVTEFRMRCGQTVLASACVLRPLNCLVLDFKMGGLMELASGGPGYTGPEMAEGITARGGVEVDSINGK